MELLDAAPPERGIGGPVGLVEGAARRRNGRLHVLLGAVGAHPEHLFGGGVHVLEGRAVAGCDEPAIDEVARFGVQLHERHWLLLAPHRGPRWVFSGITWTRSTCVPGGAVTTETTARATLSAGIQWSWRMIPQCFQDASMRRDSSGS